DARAAEVPVLVVGERGRQVEGERDAGAGHAVERERRLDREGMRGEEAEALVAPRRCGVVVEGEEAVEPRDAEALGRAERVGEGDEAVVVAERAAVAVADLLVPPARAAGAGDGAPEGVAVALVEREVREGEVRLAGGEVLAL